MALKQERNRLLDMFQTTAFKVVGAIGEAQYRTILVVFFRWIFVRSAEWKIKPAHWKGTTQIQ